LTRHLSRALATGSCNFSSFVCHHRNSCRRWCHHSQNWYYVYFINCCNLCVECAKN